MRSQKEEEVEDELMEDISTGIGGAGAPEEELADMVGITRRNNQRKCPASMMRVSWFGLTESRE